MQCERQFAEAARELKRAFDLVGAQPVEAGTHAAALAKGLADKMFSADELEALLLGARWVSLQADPELARAADGALTRIASTLPADARLGLETSGLMVPQSGTPAPPEPWLPALRRAIRDERKVVLQYRDADGQATRRTVWPFAMGFFQQSRMLAAWCELRQDFRHFRADRVLHLHPTDAPLPERRHALIRRWKAQLHTHPTADRN
jgi:predicted DNA-binding transcriptional regulator YafY